MKKLTVKPNKEQMKIIKAYWKKAIELESEAYFRMCALEEELSRETQIKELEFFRCDGELVGVGNADRTMKLIQLR